MSGGIAIFISTEYYPAYFNNFIKWKDNNRCDLSMVNVTFVQAGYIGATTLIDALLDERASRKGISVRVISSGCKMDEAEAEAAAKIAAQVPTDLYVAVSPSAGLPPPGYRLHYRKMKDQNQSCVEKPLLRQTEMTTGGTLSGIVFETRTDFMIVKRDVKVRLHLVEEASFR